MVAQSAQQAKTNAARFTACEVGKCLMYTRTWLDIPSRDFSAADAWHNIPDEFKHPGDRNPPNGAPVFWLGGSQGFGHIGLSWNTGRNNFRGTDMESAGRVSTQPLSWVDVHWTSQTYAGWGEMLNGVLIPYLSKPADWRGSGLVFVEKLEAGQQQSDSVARLRYRLDNHPDMPGTHKPGKGSGYGPEVVDAVRYWQRNIMPKGVAGPVDGSEVDNWQANRLFGDNYQVVEETDKR
jgi:hypothetical protein